MQLHTQMQGKLGNLNESLVFFFRIPVMLHYGLFFNI